MKSCLIVIDAQESFRHRPFFTEQGIGRLIARGIRTEPCGETTTGGAA
ncbi:hypothetical protein [Acidovorax sp. JG5]|nr:hypothetical protein [Acidovorax sp. JG5]